MSVQPTQSCEPVREMMRICSLLPSATEILYALGLGEQVVGVSHECDWPPDAMRKPHVIRTVIDHDHTSSQQIDRAVRLALQHRRSLYQIDEPLLQALQPDPIVTQELCDVCAIDTAQVARAISCLPHPPHVLSLHPHTLDEMLEDIHRVGEATQRVQEATQVVAALRERLTQVPRVLAGVSRPRVFCLEWLDPPMASGHWVPEMVSLAGGIEVVGRAGAPSCYVTSEEIITAKPDILVVMPCGFSIERTRQELPMLRSQPWWQALPAVRSNHVYLVNGPAYFNRSGPRLIDGIELLATLLHPDRIALPMSAAAAERMTMTS